MKKIFTIKNIISGIVIILLDVCIYFFLGITPESSGYLRIPDMVSKGIIMNVISIIILTLFVYFVLPELWNIVIEGFPESLKY